MRPSPRITTAVAKHKVRVAAAVVAAVTVGAGVGGTAYALGAHTTASAPGALSSTAPTTGHHGHHGHTSDHGRRRVPAEVSRMARVLAHAAQVQAVVPSKGSFVTMTLDRGVVSAVSTSSISISEADKQTAQDTIVSTTRVLPGVLGGISGVHDGDHVVVVAKGGVATLVWLPNVRSHVVRGTVSSVSPSSLALTRAKGKQVDLAVGPKTHVLPASLGGISGVHDGEHVAVRELAGNAVMVHVLGQARSGSTGTSGGAASTS